MTRHTDCHRVLVTWPGFEQSSHSSTCERPLQVSASLDKLGVFCRQALDCAVVADALMPPALGTTTATATAAAHAAQPRLHHQPAAAAAAFKPAAQPLDAQPTRLSDQHQQRASAWPLPPPPGSPLLPPRFDMLPTLNSLCIGYLAGTPEPLLTALSRLRPACLVGPLQPPGNSHAARDALGAILQSEVAVSLEGLWLSGLLTPNSHWHPLLQLGQVLPAGAYIKAQRLRATLGAAVRSYFSRSGLDVLLKPARTPDVGLDGLAGLLGMPELLVPAGLAPATTAASGTTAASAAAAAPAASRDAAATTTAEGHAADTTRGIPQHGQPARLQPVVASIVSLPGCDAAVVAVGAAFQAVTTHHLLRPVLPEPA